MSDSNPSTPAEPCPACSNVGRALTPQTVRSLLRPERAAELDDAEGFRFCAAQGCDVVWYRASDGRSFAEPDLTVAVGRKHTHPARPVCYCFAHTAGAIEQDGDAIYASIRAACKAGLDRCEETNPEGRCCLGEVRRVMKAAAEPTDCCVKPEAPAAQLPPDVEPKRGMARRLTTVGALLAAVLSSACCWLPLLALGLGVSAAGVAGLFEAWRWPLVGLSSALLVGAFYLVYRRRPVCEDGTCAPESGRPGFTKAMLWIASALVVAFALLPEYIGPLLATEVPATTASADQVQTLHVDGMTCEGCATHLHTALSEVPGVTRVEVSYPNKTATLWVTPGAEVATPVKAAVESLGYRVADGP